MHMRVGMRMGVQLGGGLSRACISRARRPLLLEYASVSHTLVLCVMPPCALPQVSLWRACSLVRARACPLYSHAGDFTLACALSHCARSLTL
jgi:hypothetical protein